MKVARRGRLAAGRAAATTMLPRLQSQRLRLGAVVATALLAVGAQAAPAQLGARATSAEPTSDSIHRLLRAQRDAGHAVDAALLAELEPLAARDPRALVAVVLDDHVPPVDEGDTPQRLNRYQRELALSALASAPPGALEPPRAAAIAQEPVTQQAAALRIAGVIFAPREAPLLLALATACLPAPPDDEPTAPAPAPDRALTDAFRAALGRVVAHGPESFDALSRSLPDVDRRLVPAAIAAIGDVGDPRALPLLRDELRRRRDTETLALAAIERCAPSLDPEIDSVVARSVATFLDPNDSHRCGAAVRALGALTTDVALDDLVDLLGREDGLAVEAHRALRAIGRCALPQDAELWRAWLADQRAFASHDLPRLVRDLGALEVRALAPRLRALAGRPLARHDLADEIALLLDHRNSNVRRTACAQLGALGSASALFALAEALDDDAAVAEAALAALATITPATDDRPTEPDRRAWVDWIALQTPRR